MPSPQRKHYDIEIGDLAESDVEDTAKLHALCFPDKVESLLGRDCIEETLRRRFLGPNADCYCRIARLRDSGKFAGYCYAQKLLLDGGWSNAFLSPQIARQFLIRRVWFSPALWAYIIRRVLNKALGRNLNEGANLEVGQDWEVAKMCALAPECRGGNVGRDLMLDNEAEAIARGARRVCGLIDQDNPKAERLYASIGWVRTSPDTNRFKVFSMYKDLTVRRQD